MIVQRRLSLRSVVLISAWVMGRAGLLAAAVLALYVTADVQWIRLPFLPIATVGTAVAFYVGFKNNSAYDRFWEGRKIWGGIVNVSRTWATAVLSYVEPGDNGEEARETRRRLIYRQLAWINSLRVQLRAKTRFHDNPARSTKRRLENHADHMRNDWDTEVSPFIADEERGELKGHANAATHLLKTQGLELAQLCREGKLDMFRQLELMKNIETNYELQGRCERIKNTPFPRQYAEFSRLFTRVFVVLVPFGLLDVFGDHVGNTSSALQSLSFAVPMVLSSAMITWVFTLMEGIGDSSEDPFERSMNDVPMNALCRTIEIDLRAMLGETDLPPPEQPADFVMY